MADEGAQTIFIASYNMNGTSLSQVEADAWFGQVKLASIVVLGLQECAVRPSTILGTIDVIDGQQYLESAEGGSFLCSRETDAAADKQLCETIQASLQGYKKIADVALGAPPNETKGGSHSVGFIRTMVFVLETNELIPPQLAFVPCGLKKMCGHDEGDKMQQKLGVGDSPDKGAILVQLPELDLCIANCHLASDRSESQCPEAFQHKFLAGPGAWFGIARRRCFDKILTEISDRKFANVICFGDLNERVCQTKKEAVLAIVRRSVNPDHAYDDTDREQLCSLFEEHDQLYRHLMEAKQLSSAEGGLRSTHVHVKCTVSADVRCLDGFMDLLYERVFAQGSCIHPTFPLKACKAGDTGESERDYLTKRTASWTDRVLCKGAAFAVDDAIRCR
jgi:hypothetical protein